MSASSPKARATVLTVGSLHYDIMVEADHLPRKDETAIGSRWYPKFGGKGGNQAVAAAKAGAVSRMVGAVGQDAFGTYLRDHLRRAGVDDRFVSTVPEVGSGISVAVQDGSGDYAATIVSAANLHIAATDAQSEDVWTDVSILALQNEIPEDVNLAAALIARSRGICTVLNAAPFRPLGPDLASLIDVLVVNAVEAEMMGAGSVSDLETARTAAVNLCGQFKTVIVTAGSHGLVACDHVAGVFAVSAQKVQVVSSHGAGDAFAGSLAAALGCGIDMEKACKLASAAAARHVSGLA